MDKSGYKKLQAELINQKYGLNTSIVPEEFQVKGGLEGIALAKQYGVWDKRAVVEKYKRPEAFSMMNDMIWGKRAGPTEGEFKESVIDAVYKYDCRIDAGMKWKIMRVQEKQRELRRDKNIKKKEDAVKIRTYQIIKKKTKIRATKRRIEEERRKLNMTQDEILERNELTSTLVPLKKAEYRVDVMKGVFNHIDYQKELPKEIRRSVQKISATHENVGTRSPQKLVGIGSHSSHPARQGIGSGVSQPLLQKREGTSSHPDQLSPRELYIKNRAVTKIQSIFRGRQAREWVDNQAQRLFPLRQKTSANWHSGGKRDRAIFLEKKRVLLLKSKDRIQSTKADWEEQQKSIIQKGTNEEEKRLLKMRLKAHKINKRLDDEAIMLHKNMRFIAVCIIQEFCRSFLRARYPHLDVLLAAKREKEVAENQVSLKRNLSRKGSEFRKELRKRRAVGRFAVVPIIVKMQRDWREYLAVKHSKRQISAAYALLKRMREDRISGQEFFRRLKAEHRREIEVAVEFNLERRQKYIAKCWAEWYAYTQDRLRRKSWLYHQVRTRKAKIIENWFGDLLIDKREVINKVKPNLFPPLLAEYVRFSKDNDWQKFLAAISELFSDFDEDSQVRSLEFEEFVTNKVIGFKNFTELNEMLTYHIANSDLRKKVLMIIGKEESLSFAFWDWIHKCSLYLYQKAREKGARNEALTREEEVGLLQGMMFGILIKRNLNPPSFSEKFRMRSRNYLKWHDKQELCRECMSILPLLDRHCVKCGSEQMPRYMRETQAFSHTEMLSDGVRGKPDLNFKKSLRRSKGEKNVIKGVEDVDEAHDLFVYHAACCVLAPVGGWRREACGVEEAWSMSVRDGMRCVHSLKRRGCLTISDMWGVLQGDGTEAFEEMFEGNAKIAKKCTNLLMVLDDVLHNAMGEDAVNEEDGYGGDGKSVSGNTRSTWRRTSTAAESSKPVKIGDSWIGAGTARSKEWARKADKEQRVFLLKNTRTGSSTKGDRTCSLRIPGARPFTR